MFPGMSWSLHTGGGAGTLGHGAIQMWLQRRGWCCSQWMVRRNAGIITNGVATTHHHHYITYSSGHTALWTWSVRMWNIFVTGKINPVC